MIIRILTFYLCLLCFTSNAQAWTKFLSIPLSCNTLPEEVLGTRITLFFTDAKHTILLNASESILIDLPIPVGAISASIEMSNATNNSFLVKGYSSNPGELCFVSGCSGADSTKMNGTGSVSENIYTVDNASKFAKQMNTSYLAIYDTENAPTFFARGFIVSVFFSNEGKEAYKIWKANNCLINEINTPPSPNVATNQRPQNFLPISNIPQRVDINNNIDFTLNNGKNFGITDPDASDSSQFTLNLNVTNGILNFSNTQGLSFISGSNNNSSMTINATLDDINTAFGNGLTFTPNTDFVGDATLTMISNDNGNTGSGGALTDTDSFTIIVGSSQPPNTNIDPLPVNTVPSVEQTIQQGASLLFSTQALNPFSINYTGDKNLAITLQSDASISGGFTLSSIAGLTVIAGSNLSFSGSVADINSALDGLRFTPEPDFIGATNVILTSQVIGSTENPSRSSVNIIVNAEGNTAPPTSTIGFTPLNTFIIANALGSSSTQTPSELISESTAKIAFSATRETLSGSITPITLGNSPKLSRDDFITLKAQLTPEIGHKNVRIFSIIRWANIETSEDTTSVVNEQWYQKARLQHFGSSLNGNDWGKWALPSIPLSGLSYYMDLPDTDSNDNTYTVQISAGHLIPPSGLYGFDRVAELFIGYEAIVAEDIGNQRATLFDDIESINKQVQVFAEGIRFNLEDGNTLILPQFEISLSRDREQLKNITTENSNELMTSCEFVTDSSAIRVRFVEDSNACFIELTSLAQVGHNALVTASGILNPNAVKSSALTSISRIVVVE